MTKASRTGAAGGAHVCPCCGQDIASVDREVRFGVPDVFMGMSTEERDRREGHRGDYFMRLAPDRFFVRALLPVRLSNGHEFHFGIWLEITADACATVMNAWDSSDYASLEFEGKVANAVPPWGAALLDAPCHACVRDQSQLPFRSSSSKPCCWLDSASAIWVAGAPRPICARRGRIFSAASFSSCSSSCSLVVRADLGEEPDRSFGRLQGAVPLRVLPITLAQLHRLLHNGL